jgi:hypothetical protein
MLAAAHLALLAVPLAAKADAVRIAEGAELSPRTYVNLRAGLGSSSGVRRPEICGEIAPFAFLSVEGCGTGSGFLHRDPDPELAHFRARLRLASVSVGPLWLEPVVGAGFAELQVGEDAPGFRFTDAGSGVATAGPEIGAALKAVLPLSGGFEAVGVLTLDVAWISHAPELLRPMRRFQPSLGLTAGVGF